MSAGENRCEFDSLLSPYHDGELPEAQRRAVEAHVASCPACARELAQLRALSGMLGSAPMPHLSMIAMRRLQQGGPPMLDFSAGRFIRRLTAVAAVILAASSLRLAYDWRTNQPTTLTSSAWEKVAIGEAETASDRRVTINVPDWVEENLSTGALVKSSSYEQ